jgi:hypothetical protein
MREKNCTFWKLMGSGRNGTFDLQPDWQQWGLLTTWNNLDDAKEFQEKSFIATWWRNLGCERWTVYCLPLQSHGKWDKKQPFEATRTDDYDGPVAVLTRATIKLNKLKAFWSHVDQAAQSMLKAKGYITSVGIGEAPFFKQATFSIWQSLDDVTNFAYRSKDHAEVIKKTRAENWYSEELFARFIPVKSTGTLHGINPLAHLNLDSNENYSRITAPGV